MPSTVDLRSDTVTRPTAAMREAIAAAEVGDDIFHDDPTVLELERRVADLLGKEDAVYVPSGTMANQIALRVHTQPGDVVLAPRASHVQDNELGATAVISGITIQPLDGHRGTYEPDAVAAAIPQPSPAMPASLFQPISLVWAENTHNAAGGAAWPPDRLRAVAAEAARLGLATHMDGARLWNAAAATGEPEDRLAAGFDTVSVCFSKGLGAPMGSALVGRGDLVERARFFKVMFGGGFRQAGLMAAGALHALDHHRDRLLEDHRNASRLAAGLAEIPGLALDAESVETNMVYFDVLAMSANELVDRCAAQGVLVLPMGTATVRAVTSLQVDADGIDRALEVIDDELAGSGR